MQRSLRLFVWTVALAAAAIALFVGLSYELPFRTGDLQNWLGLIILTAMTTVAQVAVLNFSAGHASLSTALIPIVAVVPLFGPTAAIFVTIISKALAFFLFLRKPAIKSVFNTAQSTLAIGLGAAVYVGLGGPLGVDDFNLRNTVIPFAALILVYFIINTSLVSVVIALDIGKPIKRTWSSIGPVAFANDLASSSFSLFVVFAFVQTGVGGLIIVLLPLVFVHHSYVLYFKLHRQNREVLELLVKTIEAKDPYTSGHSQRVAILSKQIGEELRLSPRKLEELQTASLLHDIGKIDVAYSELLGSRSELSRIQHEIIRSHPERGARLLASLSSLSKSILDAVRHHHEHFDGNGYPDGLAGEQIPEQARIIMVADTVDAMLSDRPYREALSIEKVGRELRRFSGRQFDPRVIEAFLSSGLIRRAAQRADQARTPLAARTPVLSESLPTG